MKGVIGRSRNAVACAGLLDVVLAYGTAIFLHEIRCGFVAGRLAFGAPLAAGDESRRAVAVWEDTASLLFFVHLGEAGSHRFALPVDAVEFGPEAAALDLTESVRAALPPPE